MIRSGETYVIGASPQGFTGSFAQEAVVDEPNDALHLAPFGKETGANGARESLPKGGGIGFYASEYRRPPQAP
jgi:hypothetical protein